MAIKIGHASINEKGTVSGGAAGDQNGREVCTRTWYNGTWEYVLRCKDQKKAEKMAQACEKGCANNHIGYSQSTRNTLNTQSKTVGYDLAKITKNCDTDCSAFMTVCAQSAGINVPYNGTNAPTTSTMKTAFSSTGEFEVFTALKYRTQDSYLKRGDILVRPGYHTVMVLENGSAVSATNASTANSIVRSGQQAANYFTGESIGTDGIRGANTKKVGVRVLQHAMKLDYKSGISEDGIWGPESEKALGTHYVKYGEKQYMVTALEILHKLRGYDTNGVEYPGVFGSGLEKAVKAFQVDNRLSATGVANAATFKTLIN